MKTGIELIAAERQEQITKHKRTIIYGLNLNGLNQLSIGASRLVQPESTLSDMVLCPKNWDYELWERMLKKPYKDRLIIAGALIAAEIDRLQAEQ